ncbi:MAG: hypothetical protein U5L96_21185 [Owenweeksia sp.]|nr:hypothetical protein [Owenweeksia sp.]
MRKRKLKKTTMRAQPLLIGFFSGKNFQTFLVQFSNATELKDHIAMHEVPEDVLAGWFAHELGHVSRL